ncbi:MAG: hypothetical protein IPM63_13240 [Acidobacteriota bacterium]|nr:MAG: hypothetical protein IPM63_13240 [Acidobacteriota bacterium]
MDAKFEIQRVRIEGADKVEVSAAEIDSLGSDIWCELPAGYREYMQTLGDGLLDGVTRIYAPWRIRSETLATRNRLANYWFWEAGELPQDRALESFSIASSIDGDEALIHPSRPNSIFLLPIEEETSVLIEGGIPELIEYFRASVNMEGFPPNVFEPQDSRTWDERQSREQSPIDSELTTLINDFRTWVKKYGMAERALRGARKLIEPNPSAFEIESRFGIPVPRPFPVELTLESVSKVMLEIDLEISGSEFVAEIKATENETGERRRVFYTYFEHGEGFRGGQQ